MARLLDALRKIESSQTAPHGLRDPLCQLPEPSDGGRMPAELAAAEADGRAADDSLEADSPGSPLGVCGESGVPKKVQTVQTPAADTTFQLAIVAAVPQGYYITQTAQTISPSYTPQVSLVAPFAQDACPGETEVETSKKLELLGGPEPAALTAEPTETRVAEPTGEGGTPAGAQRQFGFQDEQAEAAGPCTGALSTRAGQIVGQRYDPYAERPQDGPHARFGRQGLAVMSPGDPRQVAFANLAAQIISQLAGLLPAAVVFTSPSDGTGTTRTILPLAEALSRQLGGPLLLVDADYRKADLSVRGGVYEHRGLWDAIQSPTGWQKLVCRTDLPGVFLLPGAKQPAEADVSRLLGLGAWLQEATRHYRLVLVDAPSLAHQVAVLLAKQCHGVYLVARLQHTSARTLDEAAQLLRDQQARLLGCVVLEA